MTYPTDDKIVVAIQTTLGEALQVLRRREGHGREKLSELSGLSGAKVKFIETDEYDRFSVDDAVAAFGVYGFEVRASLKEGEE